MREIREVERGRAKWIERVILDPGKKREREKGVKMRGRGGKKIM